MAPGFPGAFLQFSHWRFWSIITSDLYVNDRDNKRGSVMALLENEASCCLFIMPSVPTEADSVGNGVSENA